MLPNYDDFKNRLAKICDATVTSKSNICSHTHRVRCAILIVRVMVLSNGERVVVKSFGVFDWSYLLLNTTESFKYLYNKFIDDLQKKVGEK